MRRYLAGFVVVMVVAGVASYVAFAQPQRGGGMTRDRDMMGQGGMMRGRMMDQDGSMQMCDMHRMMGQCVTNEQLVATPDGGVIAMVGNQLMKYDSNLELVTKTEVEIDYEAMQQRMQKMMENCPMRQGMMQGRGRQSGGAGQDNP
jgi:hypothetical protein